MKIILMGEPMGLFMANETGPLSKVNTFTASIAGAEYNVAVGLARLGHTPAYCTRLGFDPLGERILRGMRQNGIATDLVMQTEEALTGFMMKRSPARRPGHRLLPQGLRGLHHHPSRHRQAGPVRLRAPARDGHLPGRF